MFRFGKPKYPEIDDHLEELKRLFQAFRGPVDPEPLRQAYHLHGIPGLTKAIAATLHVPTRITIGFVKNGGPSDTSSWIIIPDNIPLFGDPRLKETRVTLHLRNEWLETAPFESIAFTISENLATVILYSLRHARKQDAAFTTLTAMSLGYFEFHRKGWTYPDRNRQADILLGGLDREEGAYALKMFRRSL